MAFIIAEIEAPVDDCSIAMTRDCFEPGSTFLVLGSLAVGRDDLPVGLDAADGAVQSFFASFDIEILRSVQAASRSTTEAPLRPSSRWGRITTGLLMPAI